MIDKPYEIGTVISLQTSKVKQIKDENKTWETGSFKTPVANIVDVLFDGIKNDEVSDRVHHGGEYKAVFANSYQNYPKWEKFLDVNSLEFGALSENLTIDSLNEDDVCIGDIHQIGSVVLEVTQPREPCWKIGQKHHNKKFTKYIYDSGETGWYYKILEEGQFQTKDKVILLRKDVHSITISKANNILKNPKESYEDTNQLLNHSALGVAFFNSINKNLDKNI